MPLGFRRQDRERVMRGEITVTFRLWTRAHVKAGNVYQTGFGAVEVLDVSVVPAALVAEDDIEPAGLASVDEIIALAAEHKRGNIGPETLLHRVEFRVVP
jgi:hypothetical protein